MTPEDYEAPLSKEEEMWLRNQRRRFLRNKANEEAALQHQAPFAVIVVNRATGEYLLAPGGEGWQPALD
jgi:hypothetical protein